MAWINLRLFTLWFKQGMSTGDMLNEVQPWPLIAGPAAQKTRNGSTWTQLEVGARVYN